MIFINSALICEKKKKRPERKARQRKEKAVVKKMSKLWKSCAEILCKASEPCIKIHIDHNECECCNSLKAQLTTLGSGSNARASSSSSSSSSCDQRKDGSNEEKKHGCCPLLLISLRPRNRRRHATRDAPTAMAQCPTDPTEGKTIASKPGSSTSSNSSDRGCSGLETSSNENKTTWSTS